MINFEETLPWIITALIISLFVFILSISTYYGDKDYRRDLVCQAHGGVTFAGGPNHPCAHIDRFIELPELKP